jgi:multidrug resistance efflux pump
MKTIAKLFLMGVIGLPILAGCHSTSSTTPPAALAPGAVNQFDQDSYAALMAAQASLNSLKTSYTNDPVNLASLKAPLNQAIQDYDLAELAYQTYHSAAAAGQATSAQQLAVTTALTLVQTDLKKAGQ